MRTASTGTGEKCSVDLIPNPAFIIRQSTHCIVYINQAFCQKAGYTPEELTGKNFEDSGLAIPGEAAEDKKHHLPETPCEKTVFKFLAKDGRMIETLAASRVIPFQNETCLLYVLTDISCLMQTMTDLEESEQSYRNIVENSPIAIALTRASDARYVEVNKVWSDRTGFSRNEVLERTSPELNVYRDLDVRRKLWQEFNKKGGVDDLELAFRNRRGEHLYSLVSARKIMFKGEECLLYISTKIDDLKAAQRALAEKEENYRTILEIAPYAISVTKLSDGTYLQVNEFFLKRTGYTMEEVIGRTAFELGVYADHRDRFRISELLEKEKHIDRMEIRFHGKNGRSTENLVSMSLFKYQGEDCIISVSVDISKLKQAQRALKESETRFRTIFETAADPIFLNDPETGHFLDVNSAACRHLGYTRDEFLGMTLEQILPPEMPDPGLRFDQAQFDEDGLFFESVHIRKDGSKAFVEISSQQMMQKNRRVILSIVRDVTQRKAAENELMDYKENLEKMVIERTRELKTAQTSLIQKEKLATLGQLTATVSHELRNPLGVIRSSNYFLQKKVEQKDEKITKHFNRIEEQVSHCDAIVNELLEYTQRPPVEIKHQDMTPWLEGVLKTVTGSTIAAVRTDIAKNLPQIPHDQGRMQRVLINLLNNAIQAVEARLESAGEKTGPYLPEVCLSAVPKKHGILLTVQDNGIGMNERICRKAFEPLFTTKARGTGIGLAVVKAIVEEHGGSINLESSPGKGTCAVVTLYFHPEIQKAEYHHLYPAAGMASKISPTDTNPTR